MTTKPKTRKAPAADPIFAAIAAHKAAGKELNRVGVHGGPHWSAWDRASMRLARTKSTTVAGAGALVAYLAQDCVAGYADWHMPALKTCAAALKRMEAA